METQQYQGTADWTPEKRLRAEANLIRIAEAYEAGGKPAIKELLLKIQEEEREFDTMPKSSPSEEA